jgi:hypothetical protein
MLVGGVKLKVMSIKRQMIRANVHEKRDLNGFIFITEAL